MIKFKYYPKSGTVGYVAEAGEMISCEEAKAMALIDIAQQLASLRPYLDAYERELEHIANSANSIRQSVG